MKKKNIMMFLGGSWHRFDEFDKYARKITDKKYNIESTYDFKNLEVLKDKKPGLVIFYTCIDKKFNCKKDNKFKITGSGITSLIKWVESGGSLLTFHSTTVTGNLDGGFKKLIGGSFISHPEPFHVTVYPVFKKHPVIKNIPAFTVLDELYIQDTEPDIEVLMASIYNGFVHPAVWTRKEGKGKIVNISMGHDEKVWHDINYQKLFLQSASWLVRD